VVLEEVGEDELDRSCERWTTNRRKIRCIGHVLIRNRLLKFVIDGKTEGRI
jgi:hypothetical protein